MRHTAILARMGATRRCCVDDLGELWRAHVKFAGTTAGVFLVVAYLRLRWMLLPQK